MLRAKGVHACFQTSGMVGGAVGGLPGSEDLSKCFDVTAVAKDLIEFGLL